MKVVILAGGRGTRIGEETVLRPKPMIEIGGRPILWHIMKWYASFGYDEFIICCGYKGQIIKEYFVNYPTKIADVEYDVAGSKYKVLSEITESWKVTLANTGLDTLTAGRILRIKDYIGDDKEFMLTYGDGVSDVNLDRLLDTHHRYGTIATITATQPTGRFGTISIDDNSRITGFREKSREDSAWVNAGFMVLDRRVFDYLGDGSTMLETEPFNRLVSDNELAAYRHDGFWSPMDNIRDRDYLEELWKTDSAPWKA